MRRYSSAEVEQIAGITTVQLRDWRRRHLLDGVGVFRPDGKWAYRKGDVLALLMANLVMEGDVSINTALGLATRAVPLVFARLEDWTGSLGEANRAVRFVVAFNLTGQIQFELFNNFAAIEAWRGMFFSVLDAEHMAREIAAWLPADFLEASK